MVKGLFTFILLFAQALLLAQKTDVVILKNGDRITGEIKKLDLEILQLKTSTMSTVQIKWYKVSNIIAPDKYCQVELKDKTRIFGSLDSTSIPNSLRLTSEMGEFNIPTTQVVTIIQVKQVFWNRFSGNLGAGLSFTKASQVIQFNGNAFISYSDEVNYSSLSASSIRTEQPDRDKTIKEDINLNFNRTLFPRQFSSVFAGNQINTELGIANRLLGGAGYGYDIIHSAVSRVRLIGGAMVTRETTLQEQDITNNGEGFLTLNGEVFKYTDPEVYLTSSLSWYPSMTVPGRNRIELDIKIRFELLNNLFLEFKFYDNFDSKPASESAANNDYGIISSFQYTFGL